MPKKITKDNTTIKTASSGSTHAQENLDRLIAPDSHLELSLSWKEVEPIYLEVLKNEARKLKIRGFRKGKVPINIAEKELGAETIINQVLQKILPQAYSEAIKSGNRKPLTYPEFQPISINKDNDWVIKAYFAEEPEIQLKDYKKVAIKAKKEVEAELKKDAKQKENNQKESTKSKKATPSSEMTDQQKKDTIIQRVLAELVTQFQPAIPRLLIKETAEREMSNLLKQLDSLKVKLDTFLEARRMTQEQLSSQLMVSSISQLQVEFLLRAIAQQEKIEVKEDEIKETIEKTEDERVRAQMHQDESYQTYLKQMLLKQKTIELILSL